MEKPKARISDEQLTKELRFGKLANVGGKILCAIGILIVIIGAATGPSIPLIILGIVTLCIGEWIKKKKSSDAHRQLNNTVVPDALNAVFENVEFDSSRHIMTIEDSGIPIPAHTDVDGGEYVNATYRGFNVELSNIRLTSREEYQNEETGLWEQTEQTVYSGKWAVCKFNVETPVSLTIWPRDNLDKLFRLATIKTNDDKFNKSFNLSADSEQSALHFLNPSRMERFHALSSMSGGKLSISLKRDGTLYIALQNGHGFFDPGKGHEDASALRQRFTSELRWFADMTDVFRPI